MTESVNGFLFRGEIRGYWRLLARGADPASIVQHRHKDRRFDFGLDANGFAKRSGGIISPTDRTLGTGRFLYRFVGTQSYAKRKSSAVLGHWWLDEDNWPSQRSRSRQSLRSVARSSRARRRS